MVDVGVNWSASGRRLRTDEGYETKCRAKWWRDVAFRHSRRIAASLPLPKYLPRRLLTHHVTANVIYPIVGHTP